MLQKQNKADAKLSQQILKFQNSSLLNFQHRKLEQFNTFLEYTNCKELLSNLGLCTQKFTQSEYQEQTNSFFINNLIIINKNIN
ncbi:unnamed protein product [Paramecium octaurelia]|uniref:Uncharacterized protein n=1 Tax=Paramecium octaurelia TaxID=43137 RepID=A0A8S1YSW8_PAROT|nr:unnamed protein product [Paramecium octaurelia]